MKTLYNPNQSPRVIIIQKLYGNFFNEETDIKFTKHRFKKFIKDVVMGTIERDEVINEELILNQDIGRIRDFEIDSNGDIFIITDQKNATLWKLTK